VPPAGIEPATHGLGIQPSRALEVLTWSYSANASRTT
jgi:hypothetical protein